ncbi:MAG: hypothetical protein P8Y65_11020 [Campylobacterales bacterium]|jgi:hypothetical protein
MAKKKAVEAFTDSEIVFELDRKPCRLLRLNPNSMEVTVLMLDDRREFTLPFAHLPKNIKKRIRPL